MSSRRRHTRWPRDWSSDVCSSDLASAERISEVLDLEVDLTDHEDAKGETAVTEGQIDFKDVNFTYPYTRTTILKDFSFSLHAVETLALIGATGVGKTTLFQLLLRLYVVDDGKVIIDGEPITKYKLKDLRNSIGYVPQSPLLFTGSVARSEE